MLEYAQEVIGLGVLWDCFHDAIKEGDDDRLKYMLLTFKAARRTNYMKEAVILLHHNKSVSCP